MPEFMGHNYSHLKPGLAEMLGRILPEHRDFISERQVKLPMDF
jgi:hypothetical protein